MRNQAFPKSFKEVVAAFLSSTFRLAKIRGSFTAAGKVKRLTAALEDNDVFLPLLAAEELAKTGREDSLPGLRRALGDPMLVNSALKGIADVLHGTGKVDQKYRDELFPAVLSLAVAVEDERTWTQAVSVLRLLKPEDNLQILLSVARKAGRGLPVDLIVCLVNENSHRLRAEELVSLAEALLPHRDHVRAGDAFDALVRRIWEAGIEDSISGELRETMEADKARALDSTPRAAGMSRMLERIALSQKSYWHKISAIHSALDDRFARRGISVGYNNDREFELQYMSHPEWVIRNVNSFLCGCENNGSLSRQMHNGIPLIKYLEETGIHGCVRALKRFQQLEAEEEAREQAQDEDEEDERYAEYILRLEQAERDAQPEDMEECCRLLWDFAMEYSSQVLSDAQS